MNATEIGKTLESTLLSPTASSAAVEALCREAAEMGCYGVCISPCRVADALGFLKGTQVRVVSVAGFPLGGQTARTKAAEAADLAGAGVHEIDVVANLGFFLEGRYREAAEELRLVRRECEGLVLKVILETGYLSAPQIEGLAKIAVSEGADFLKTSTGHGPRGASVEDVRILAGVRGEKTGIKASGGIRTLGQVADFLAAGASRIGTSSAAFIMREAKGAVY